MARFTAIFDANVLYRAAVRDLVMELAVERVYRARWSDTINDEWVRNLLTNRADLDEAKIRRTVDLMNRALPDANVSGFESMIDSLKLADPKDRHVLAAAIVGSADVIVTYNLRHFLDADLAPYGIEAQHPDVFLNYQRDLDERAFLLAAKRIRARVGKSPDEYLASLRSHDLPLVVNELEKVKSLL